MGKVRIMTHICTICHRELPDSKFHKSDLKRYHYQCIKCSREKNNKYTAEVRDLPNEEFDRFYGGYTVAILNHVRPNEYKYTIKGTDGLMIQTNDIDYFRKKFEEVI